MWWTVLGFVAVAAVLVLMVSIGRDIQRIIEEKNGDAEDEEPRHICRGTGQGPRGRAARNGTRTKPRASGLRD